MSPTPQPHPSVVAVLLALVAGGPAAAAGAPDVSLLPGSRAQAVAPDRIALVTMAGRRAARFEVRQGDNPLAPVNGRRAMGDRAELAQALMAGEGDAGVYAWSTYFPPDFPAILPTPDDPYSFQIFAQWHQEARTGSPPLYFLARGDAIALATHVMGSNGEYHGGPIHWQAPMDRGRWHDFRLAVRWSASPERGSIALWHDGRPVLPPKAVATLVPGQRNYLKLGLYRSSRIEAPGVVYHADFRTL